MEDLRNAGIVLRLLGVISSLLVIVLFLGIEAIVVTVIFPLTDYYSRLSLRVLLCSGCELTESY